MTQVSVLKTLKMDYLQENYQEFLKEMAGKPVANVIETLLERELCRFKENSLERRFKQSKLEINKMKFMTDFQWDQIKGIEKQQIESLLELSFLKDCANLIFCGPEGVGKTMLAKNIGYQAVLKGHSVLYVGTSWMLNRLSEAEGPRLLNSRLKMFTNPDLLILDEFGYLSYGVEMADLLFEVINQRYESGSTIITTNMPFTQWPKIFPGASCIRAIIDRLIHHSEIYTVDTIDEESFRMREAKARQSKQSAKNKGK